MKYSSNHEFWFDNIEKKFQDDKRSIFEPNQDWIEMSIKHVKKTFHSFQQQSKNQIKQTQYLRSSIYWFWGQQVLLILRKFQFTSHNLFCVQLKKIHVHCRFKACFKKVHIMHPAQCSSSKLYRCYCIKGTYKAPSLATALLVNFVRLHTLTNLHIWTKHRETIKKSLYI